MQFNQLTYQILKNATLFILCTYASIVTVIPVMNYIDRVFTNQTHSDSKFKLAI
ncbi:hypothetical protein C8Q75DRAFT_724071 [Abortiporus biennis]|nr:hypothetical protein C8Q75DRAFT_724071 [Abortiporus biennis]